MGGGGWIIWPPCPLSSVAGFLSFSILIEVTIYLVPEEAEEETPDWPWVEIKGRNSPEGCSPIVLR